jgi:hypothetical protein
MEQHWEALIVQGGLEQLQGVASKLAQVSTNTQPPQSLSVHRMRRLVCLQAHTAKPTGSVSISTVIWGQDNGPCSGTDPP